MNKTKIVVLLLAVAILLFLINLFVDSDSLNSKLEDETSLSKLEIEKIVNLTLNEFAIEKDWITKRKLREQTDSLTDYQLVQIPNGLSISVVVKELNKSFLSTPIKLLVNEKDVSEETVIEFNSGGVKKFLLKLKYNSELSRVFSQISFILTEYDDLSLEKKDLLFKSAYPFGVVLPLEQESTQNANEIKTKRKEYFVELSYDSDYMDFQLNNELAINKLNKNITKIISFFNSPKYFLINSEISKFNTSIIKHISEQFSDRGRIILLSENFFMLRGENINDLKSLLEFYLKNIKPNENKCFFINSSDWFEIQTIIADYLKKGNRIVFPNKILSSTY